MAADFSVRSGQPALELRRNDASEGVPALCQHIVRRQRGRNDRVAGELDDGLEIQVGRGRHHLDDSVDSREASLGDGCVDLG